LCFCGGRWRCFGRAFRRRIGSPRGIRGFCRLSRARWKEFCSAACAADEQRWGKSAAQRSEFGSAIARSALQNQLAAWAARLETLRCQRQLVSRTALEDACQRVHSVAGPVARPAGLGPGFTLPRLPKCLESQLMKLPTREDRGGARSFFRPKREDIAAYDQSPRPRE